MVMDSAVRPTLTAWLSSLANPCIVPPLTATEPAPSIRTSVRSRQSQKSNIDGHQDGRPEQPGRPSTAM